MLKQFLHHRRGAVSLIFSIAAIPLIGMAGLGTEAASWYATKRHAQNAADAAAYAGAIRLACSLGSTACADTQSVDYRGKEFAAQNSFCNQGATAYPGSTCSTLGANVTQGVAIDVGNYGSGTFSASGSGSAVRATVSQTQPYLLASLFFSGNVNIVAQAIALVENPSNACMLGLGIPGQNSPGLTIGGNPQWSGGNCSLVSNTNVKLNSSPNFPAGQGWQVDGASGCSSASNCGAVSPNAAYNWYALPATNPLQALNSLAFAVSTQGKLANLSASTNQCKNGTLSGTTCTFAPTCPTTYTASQCGSSVSAYGGLSITGGNVVLSPGTYIFYNANININGGTVTGSNVTIVLLGNSSLSITGGTTNFQVTADMNNTTFPALSGVLLDDQAPFSNSNGVTINGSSTSYYGGAVYAPNNNVTWDGNAAAGTGCTEVVGGTITIQGTTNFDTSGCPSNIVPQTQVVALVQ